MTITTRLEVYPENSPPLPWAEAMAWCEALGDGWRAPTKEELNVLYQHKDEIGGFGEGWLWSSSQYSSYNAWKQNFSDGDQYYSNKDYGYSVRACRASEEVTKLDNGVPISTAPFDINEQGRTVPLDVSDEEWRAERALHERRYFRDKFAGRVLQGMCTGSWPKRFLPEELAKISYEIADAMLKERDA